MYLGMKGPEPSLCSVKEKARRDSFTYKSSIFERRPESAELSTMVIEMEEHYLIRIAITYGVYVRDMIYLHHLTFVPLEMREVQTLTIIA